jgi:uncharacterized protein with NRDE domain
MCLAAAILHPNNQIKCAVVFNRDEFFSRPTKALHYWESGIVAGQDLVNGGTWLGMNKFGKIAFLTNIRNPKSHKQNQESRGRLVSKFLETNCDVSTYVTQVEKQSPNYNGFNIVLIDIFKQIFIEFNTCTGPKEISLGQAVSLSNGVGSGQQWQKQQKASRFLLDATENSSDFHNAAQKFLRDKSVTPDSMLPETGMTLEEERLLSSVFVNSATYGTRAVTSIAIGHDNKVVLCEATYSEQQLELETTLCFSLS